MTLNGNGVLDIARVLHVSPATVIGSGGSFKNDFYTLKMTAILLVIVNTEIDSQNIQNFVFNICREKFSTCL